MGKLNAPGFAVVRRRPPHWLATVVAVLLWILAIWLLLFVVPSPVEGQEIAPEREILGLYTCPPTSNDVTHVRIYADGALVSSAPITALSPFPRLQDCNGDGEESEALYGVEFADVPTGCVSRSYTVRFAIELTPGQFQESADSDPVETIGRPWVESVEATEAGIREIRGDNLTADVVVTTPDGTTVPSEFVDCATIRIVETPTRTIVVDTGLLPFVFEFPIERPVLVRAR